MAVVINGNGAVTGLTALPDSAMASGSVINIVEDSHSTQVIVASTTYGATGLSASITPSSTSSKIFVVVQQAYMTDRDSGSGVNGRLRLLRDTTTILDHTPGMNNTLGFSVQDYAHDLTLGMRVPLFKLDSPSTTSSVTYSTKIAAIVTSNNGMTIAQPSDMISTIHLLEIAP